MKKVTVLTSLEQQVELPKNESYRFSILFFFYILLDFEWM